ncbi:MAG TPA: pyruvate carboxylase, partial [Corynebacterium kroppenstedtii]|nr:pyruvate carboxylase [Corynebacterium kroppenstedtii]
EAARMLVTELRKEFDLPIHIHTHDTAGGSLATYMAAWEAGADAIDGASAPMAGTTSQPSLSAIVAATANTKYDTGLDLAAVSALEPYWEGVRSVYAPFDKGLAAPTGRVYNHEIPGGQLTNLRAQATALGLEHNFEQIEDAYAAADKMLGHLVKVTPSSKVVGDLALQLVGAGIDPADFAANPNDYDIPDSVIGFLNGELGTPPGGWPEPFRTQALKGREKTPEITPVSAEDEDHLNGSSEDRRNTLNRLLFPGPAADFDTHRNEYGEVSRLSTNQFFFGLYPNEEQKIQLAKGIDLIVQLQSISEPDARGVRTVMCFLNGELRPVFVRDESVEADVNPAEKADRSNPGHVAAPYAGNVTVTVDEGDTVHAGDKIAVIEAMKMEASITAPVDGTIERIISDGTFHVDGGDLVVVIS